MKCWHGCILLGLLACYGSIYHSIIFRFYDQSRNLSLSVWMHMPLCTLLWSCIVPCRPFLFHGACCNTSCTFLFRDWLGVQGANQFVSNITKLTWLWCQVIRHIMELWTIAPMDVPRLGVVKLGNLVHRGISVERN